MRIGVERKKGTIAGRAMLLVGIWGAGALFMWLFWVKEGDVAATREEVFREQAAAGENAATMVPKVMRRDFEFGQPVPGEKGKYEWKMRGKESVSVDVNTDRITEFRGETEDTGETIRMTSPVVLFAKEKRVITSDAGVVVELPWAEVKSPEMAMELESHDTRFSGGVTTEIDREKAEKVLSPTPENAAGGKDTEEETSSSQEKEKKKTKKKSPLVINSRELRLFSKKNLAIFIGDVEAKDESGSIVADRMEAYNYTKEETKKDPALKGVKTVICTGDVIIDQIEGKKQARCPRAVFDAKSNTLHLYYDEKTGKKVVYRDEVDQMQVEAFEMILDREKSEVKFLGKVKMIDFNPDRKGFLGMIGPDEGEKSTP
jgi:lipopolysaccharide export system protein LptA